MRIEGANKKEMKLEGALSDNEMEDLGDFDSFNEVGNLKN